VVGVKATDVQVNGSYLISANSDLLIEIIILISKKKL
jgi:hypothetical protein